MKTNELMLGDIITFKDSIEIDEIPVPIKVIALGHQERGNENEALVKIGDEETCDIVTIDDNFVGYPLTAEILKKNGFEFGYTAREEDFCCAVGCGYPDEKGWCYDEGAGEVKIVFPNDTDGGIVRLDDECDNRYIEFIFVEPIMVHELQHALRLCGINKEIII